MSEAEEMELFKKEFYEDLSKITNHRTVSNAAVNISGEAFKAMKDDPQYREKVLSLIQRDWGDSYAPRNCSVLITVGATLNEYRADSWPVGYDSEFDMRSSLRPKIIPPDSLAIFFPFTSERVRISSRWLIFFVVSLGGTSFNAATYSR